MNTSYNIVISGASRGIGFAIAKAFAQQGCNLAIYSRNEEDLMAARHTLLALGAPLVFAKPTNASSKQEVQQFAEEAMQALNGCDVLVNNAGVFIPGSLESEADGVFENLMTSNVDSAYHLTRALLPQLKQSTRAHIFNISSIAGHQAYDSGSSYSISKFAVTGLSRALRKELMPYRIRVSNISPGATLTDSWGNTPLPPERFIDPNHLGKLIVSFFDINLNTVIEEIILRPVDGDL